MMSMIKAMFGTPNRGNQSLNINQLSTALGDIAYQVNDSLLTGVESVKVDALNNTVALNCGITSNQSAKTLADVSAKIYANQSPKFTENQSGEYFSGYKSADILHYPNSDISKRGEYTSFAKGEFFHFVIGSTTKNDIEFCQFTKKGSTLDASLSSNGNQKKDGVGILNLFVQRRQIISYSFDCLALRCLRLISAFTAVTINCALLSPSSKFFSKSATTSCGKRAFSCWDLLLVELVAITRSPCDWCESVYAKKNARKGLKCDSLGDKFKSEGAIHQKATPRSATNTIEAFNHNVNRSNTMAMYKSTQTRPKFLWRFFSCQQFKYFIVIASSEQEARSMLPDSPCLFSARFAEGESV